MGFKKEQIQQHKQAHYWAQNWTKSDWDNPENIEILMAIHKEYQECLEFWNNNKSSRFYPAQIYQIRNGGMSKSGAVYYDEVKAANGDFQKYQINEWMLQKYFMWREANMTHEEKQLSEIHCREVSAEIAKLLSKTVNNIKV